MISNIAGIDDDPRMFQVTIPIQPGNSGGPLFDSRGRVVGIVTSTLNDKLLFKAVGTMPQNVNFAIKASYLRSILALVPGSDCATGLDEKQSAPFSATDIQERFSQAVIQVNATR